MKIRRIKKLRVNTTDFIIKWDNSFDGASFNYWDKELKIGTKDIDGLQLFNRICHELFEVCSIELCVRFRRPDVDSDYIFVFDHRQHHTMMEMFAGLLERFIH